MSVVQRLPSRRTAVHAAALTGGFGVVCRGMIPVRCSTSTNPLLWLSDHTVDKAAISLR